MNKGGFSWNRYVGISGAKARMSRKIGVRLTRSGRHQKIGRSVTGGGCLMSLLILGFVSDVAPWVAKRRLLAI
jgi:hypothetical protein